MTAAATATEAISSPRVHNANPWANTEKAKNGFYVVDTSEVQARKPNAQMKIIAAVEVRDGTAAQHTIPIKVAGKAYIVHVDERKELITMCQHTGVLVMQFENSAWPMKESTPAIEQNN